MRHRFGFLFGLFLSLLILVGSGCASRSLNEWTPIADGIEELDAIATTVSSTHIVMYAFDPTKYSFQFAYATSGKSILGWHGAYPKATAVFNGTFFNQDFSPSGNVIHRGAAFGTRQFDLDRTAYVVFAPRTDIIDTAHEVFVTTSSSEAAQSYPLLLKDGRAMIKVGSTQTARRTFVALRADHFVVLGVIADGAVTLYQLSNELTQSRFRLTRALNLDGGPSTGVSVHVPDHEKRINSFAPVSIGIIVTPTQEK